MVSYKATIVEADHPHTEITDHRTDYFLVDGDRLVISRPSEEDKLTEYTFGIYGEAGAGDSTTKEKMKLFKITFIEDLLGPHYTLEDGICSPADDRVVNSQHTVPGVDDCLTHCDSDMDCVAF